MALVNYKAKNNASTTMASGISAGAVSMIVATGAGDLFPSTFPFELTLEQFTGSNVTKREIVKCTARTGDTLTIVRSAGYCPASYTALTQTNTAFAFSTGDTVSLRITANIIDDLNAELVRVVGTELPLKLNKATYDAERTLFGASSIGTDAYKITSADVVTYVNGQTFKIQADVANTGSATLELNSLGAKTLKRLNAGVFEALATGDIIVNQIFFATYNSPENCFQFSVDPANVTIPTVAVSKLEDSTYPVGEDVTAGNVVFIEPSATFAQATSVQNIGDVAGNTRVSLPCFGAGVSGTTQKLSLKKFVSPSVSLGIRIETDDGSGNPSGTLAHANATATVTAGSLTTSLADTTITFAGAFTLTAGVKYHIVLFQGTYGAETINGTNYYGLGYYTNNSTTRNSKKYNGSVWAAVYSSVGSTNATLAGSSPQNNSSVAPLGLQYLAINDVIINTITKNASTAATKAYIKNDAGTILDTMTFSGNVATPTTTIVFPAGTYFRVELDDNGASFANRREQVPTTYPQVGTDVSITSNSLSGANDPVGNQNNSIITINTGVATLVPIFPYSSSSLFYDAVLSKTCALFSYKIDWHGIASETKTVGQFPKIVISGIDSNQTGRTLGATQYLSDTVGAISGSAGTNSKKIGKAISATQIKIIDIPL